MELQRARVDRQDAGSVRVVDRSCRLREFVRRGRSATTTLHLQVLTH